MSTPESAGPRTPRRGRVLLRGESAVAFIGLAMAAILIGAMSGSAWWVLRSQRQMMEQSRRQEIAGVGQLLAASSETMLATDQLSAVRRLVMETAQQHKLSTCRIVAANGRVIADADPSQIMIQTVAHGAGPAAEGEGVFTEQYPLTVGGQTVAELTVAAPIAGEGQILWQAQAGMGAISVAALLAWIGLYRRARARLRTAGTIREAVLAVQRGQETIDTLGLSNDFGPEAEGWNRILGEVENLRGELTHERAQRSLGGQGAAAGDLGPACDAMAQGLVLVDQDLRAVYANGAAAVFLGTKRDQTTQRDVTELISDVQVASAVRAAVSGAGRRREVIEVDQNTEGKGGVLRFSICQVKRSEAAKAMIVIEDISQQRVANDARTAFVTQATHELRTPLTNIRLYVEMALEDGENDPSVRAKSLNVINEESQRLERMVGDLLTVAEIEAGSFKLHRDDVNLQTLLEQLEADYQALATEKSIVLEFNLPPKLPTLQADRDKIALALHNLVANAIKYTPTQGNVTVTAESSETQVNIQVTDTGIGIAPDEQPRIFEKFYRSSDDRVRDVTGSGLGLGLAREVIGLHGGDITVDSQPDHGSTFTVTLPVQSEAA